MINLYGARISLFNSTVKVRFFDSATRDEFIARHPDFRPIRKCSFPDTVDAVSRAFYSIPAAEAALNH